MPNLTFCIEAKSRCLIAWLALHRDIGAWILVPGLPYTPVDMHIKTLYRLQAKCKGQQAEQGAVGRSLQLAFFTGTC